MFADHVLRDLIINYNISNEDLWIQSDNALYKNKHSFGLLQSLADEFNLRIICIYGAAGHGKTAIDAMSSFGVKNILRKDIVRHDVFFNSSCDILNIPLHRSSVLLQYDSDGQPCDDTPGRWKSYGH